MFAKTQKKAVKNCLIRVLLCQRLKCFGKKTQLLKSLKVLLFVDKIAQRNLLVVFTFVLFLCSCLSLMFATTTKKNDSYVQSFLIAFLRVLSATFAQANRLNVLYQIKMNYRKHDEIFFFFLRLQMDLHFGQQASQSKFQYKMAFKLHFSNNWVFFAFKFNFVFSDVFFSPLLACFAIGNSYRTYKQKRTNFSTLHSELQEEEKEKSSEYNNQTN